MTASMSGRGRVTVAGSGPGIWMVSMRGVVLRL